MISLFTFETLVVVSIAWLFAGMLTVLYLVLRDLIRSD